jgi:ribosomal protein S20
LARSKQSVKRHITDMAKTRRNLGRMRAMRTAIRRVGEAETPEAKEAAFRRAQSLIDKAGRTRLIHPNKADRLKGNLSATV